ncbi:MAG: response regulator [Bacillota bacterium]
MGTTGHILICDDQPIIHETIIAYLKADGFTYDSAFDGEEALRKALEIKPDLIILDLMMPKTNGIDVCRTLRKTSDVPIIMLTAKGEEIDRILGLELGADDYIVKPFSPREVVARVKAVLRRRMPNHLESRPALRYDGLEINLSAYEVRLNGNLVPCTPKEVEVLYFLAAHPGQVSHEFHTPVSAPRALAETLLDDMVPDEETKKRYYGHMLHETMRLSRLINDLLMLSRLQSGAVSTQREAFQINELMGSVADRYTVLAAEKNITFSFSPLPAG